MVVGLGSHTTTHHENDTNMYRICTEITYPFTWLMTRNPDTVMGVEKV